MHCMEKKSYSKLPKCGETGWKLYLTSNKYGMNMVFQRQISQQNVEQTWYSTTIKNEKKVDSTSNKAVWLAKNDSTNKTRSLIQQPQIGMSLKEQRTQL